MNRKVSCLALVALLLALGLPVEAQQTGKVFRIGYPDAGTASGSAMLLEAFRQEMSKLGWIEGKNITIEYRFAEQRQDNCPARGILSSETGRMHSDLSYFAELTIGETS